MSRDITVAPPLERLVPLFPQLEIDGMVAVNELAAVFRARQTGLDRRVALKILPEFVAGDEKLVDAFTADARTMASLQHPNLVRVFDFGESDSLLWVIQEWVEGRTLREILAEGAMSVQRSGELLGQICRGLGYAHEHGAIHGDIRASHVMLDEKQRTKLMNFGLGRLVLAEANINMPGVVAPELLDPDLQVDHRADIFALGVLFYEMLVGERPVGEVDLPSVARPGIVGPECDIIVIGCLHPDPDRRFQDCTALRMALEELIRIPEPSIRAPLTTKPVPRMAGATPLPRQQPVYFPDGQASSPKWPLILGLLVAIAIGGWLVKRHYSNIEQIEADHDRKIRDVEEKIAENERAMEAAKRAENSRAAQPPEATADDRAEDPGIVKTDIPPGESDPEENMADGGGDSRVARVEDDPPLDPVADPGPEDHGADPAAAGRPPLAPELQTMVPKIPELDLLRTQLMGNAIGTVAELSEQLATLQEEYSQSCAEKRASAASSEVDFWSDEQTGVSLFGRPPFELPQAPPRDAKSMRDRWGRDFAHVTAPLARLRQIYLDELAKIQHAYSRQGNQQAIAALALERSAAIDPNYFLFLCSGRLDQCGLMLPGNVAHRSMGAVGSGVSTPDRINDGIDNMCSGHIREPIRLELGGLLRVARIKFVLNSNYPNHHFRYIVRVSPDGEHWEQACDRGESGEWKKEQDVEFVPRAIRFIELLGTYNSLENGLFSIRELEAYCTPEGG